jgi:hypothetical protein
MVYVGAASVTVLRTILRFLRATLLWVLLLYWLVFVGYTFEKLATGGREALVAWYAHISAPPLLAEFHWNWGLFIAKQAGMAAVTLALLYLEWRDRRKL